MQLFILRHAHAIDLADDDARPLSRRGHDQVRALADFLRRSGAFAPAAIWHSPLVRARETAAGLAEKMALRTRLVETPGLRPEDDPAGIARKLSAGPERLALVGHEPHLSALASLLVTGAASPPAFLLRKCAVIALEGAGEHWAVRWHLSPELLSSDA